MSKKRKYEGSKIVEYIYEAMTLKKVKGKEITSITLGIVEFDELSTYTNIPTTPISFSGTMLFGKPARVARMNNLIRVNCKLDPLTKVKRSRTYISDYLYLRGDGTTVVRYNRGVEYNGTYTININGGLV